MEWKHYWNNVVQRYSVIIEGWPVGIPFKNLSGSSSALPELEQLLQMWQSGEIYWKKLSDDELDALKIERNKQIEAGTIQVPHPRRRRSDHGKKRGQPSKKHKSAEFVNSDNEEPLI